MQNAECKVQNSTERDVPKALGPWNPGEKDGTSSVSRRLPPSPTGKALTMADIIAKRRARWTEKKNFDYDRALVKAAARKILKDEGLIKEVQERPYLLIEACFSVVDKKRNTVPFFLNEVQQDFIRQLEEKGTDKPYFILKGRQQGFTTLITAIQLANSIVKKNFAGFTLADKASNSVAIFNDKARVVYDRLPDELKPHEKFNSRNELFFDKLNSSWRVDTATDQVGRSRTLSSVHFSEVAFYTCSLSDLQAAIKPAIIEGALVVYETTANGFNEAKDLWDGGSCHNLFYEWWRSGEYRSTRYQYLEYQDAWLEERKKLLYDLGLDREQICWYCETYAGYLDKSLIRQEYPCTPDEAFVASGSSIFDTEAITAQMARIARRPADRIGYFEYRKVFTPIYSETGELVGTDCGIEDIAFKESADGYIAIHEEPIKKCDREGNITELAPYVIGGDTAGTGEDYFTAKVICNLDGRTVATLRKQIIDEDLYAEQVYCLGKYYNDAFIGIEINYSMYPTRVLAKKYSYPNLYMRRRFDTNTEQVEMEYGFNTTPRTRPVIISELVEIMREDISLEVDKQTLREMLTFVKKDNGRQEAIDGEHDDLVMALAIAHNISKDFTHSYIKAESEDIDVIAEMFGSSGESEGGNGGYMTWDDF